MSSLQDQLCIREVALALAPAAASVAEASRSVAAAPVVRGSVAAAVDCSPEQAASNPRFSVIVPVRNAPRELRLCLLALSESSFRDFEIIVVDDASTDETASVAEALGARVVRLTENCGSAAARNAGAQAARGQILLFVDADVLVHPDSLEVASESFDDTGVDAIFGSYDLEPYESNLLSQYKNLAHRYVHQASRDRACTFWTGCGAIRSEVFRAFGGFNASRYRRPMIEDIELGVRLTRAGRTVLINKQLQVKHLKRWSLAGMIKSDICDRAIPWTRLILQTRDLPDDMNLAGSQRVSALLAGVFVVVLALASWQRPWLGLLPVMAFGAIALADWWTSRQRAGTLLRLTIAAAILLGGAAGVWYGRWWTAVLAMPLVGVIVLNWRFYRFFMRHRGPLFVAAALPMHVLYYLYSAAVFATGVPLHRVMRAPDTAPSRAAAMQSAQSADVTTGP